MKVGNRVLSAVTLAALTACAPDSRAPSLEGIDDQVVAVGEELVVNLRATDPDGDQIHYGFDASLEGIQDRADLALRPDGTAVFRWTPVGDDVGEWAFDFIASDGTANDVITSMIEVRPAVDGTAPVFREPIGSGTTLDLSFAACIEVDVVVDDPDSAAVTLGQAEPAIAGSQFVQATGVAGVWAWCPNKDQLGQDRYPLVLFADDGDHDPVFKNYLVVLRSPPRPDCPGKGPVIDHVPANVDTLLDVEIVAEVSDDLGLRAAPVVYYTTEEPHFPVDFGTLDVVEMELGSGDLESGVWTARLPNPVADAGKGATAELFYIISASDDDDAQGDCDHLTDAPEEGMFRMTVGNPGGDGGAGLCEACSADVQCGGGKDNCVVVGDESESFCLTTCDGNGDCDDGFSCQEVESVDALVAKQCVPDSGSCEDMVPECEDDAKEDNDTRAEAAANGNTAEGTYEDLVSCVGDEDWYRVNLNNEGTIGALIEGGNASNLNLGLYDEFGNEVAVSDSNNSSEVVEECVEAGTYYLRVWGLGGDDNTYDLLLEKTPMACDAPTCDDDSFEEDDNFGSATFADLDLGDFSANNRMLCSGDDDYYEIELYTGETLVVDLTFEHGSSSEDLDLHFYNEAHEDLTPCDEGQPELCSADQGQSASDNEHYEYEVEAGCFPCTFFVEVHGWDGSEQSYDIDIAI